MSAPGINPIIYTSELRTSDATQTTLATINTYPSGSYQIKAFITGKKSSTGDVGAWEITCLFKNIAGTTTQVGTPDIIENQDQAWTVTFSTSGSNIVCLVTGAAASNIVWQGEIQVNQLQLIN